MTRFFAALLTCVASCSLSAVLGEAQAQSIDSSCLKSQNLLDEAEGLIASENFRLALRETNEAVSNSPQCARAHLLLGHCQWGLNWVPEAGKSYEKVLELNPENPDAKAQLDAIAEYYRVEPAARALKAKRWRAVRTTILELTEGQMERLGPVATAISWHYRPTPLAAFPDLMEAYRRFSQFDCIDVIETTWRHACSDCELAIQINRLATLHKMPDAGAAEKVRLEILSRLDSGEPIIENLASPELLGQCGWRYSGPELLDGPTPRYTRQGLRAKAEGIVLLHVIIERDGRVRDTRVLRSLEPSLDEVTSSTVKQKWRFRPALLDDRPVRCRATIEVGYRLR